MRRLLLLPALLLTPALVAMTFVSGCQNTLKAPVKKPSAWQSSGAVISGQALVWGDLEKATVDCGKPLLVSAWSQLFPVASSDPHSSEQAQVSWSKVRAVSSARDVSMAAVGIELSIDGFASISVNDGMIGASGDASSQLSIIHDGQLTNIDVGANHFPRVLASFSPDTVGRRENKAIPQATDPIVSLRYSDSTEKEVQVQVVPPMGGVASHVTLEVGEYSKCLRLKLKLTDPA